jgi:hypothetical protein
MWRILASNTAMRAYADARAEQLRGVLMADMQLLDGRYDAFIVWAEARDSGGVAFDLTITTGIHKGDVLTVLGTSRADPITLVGLPCTLIVQDGEPTLEMG